MKINRRLKILAIISLIFSSTVFGLYICQLEERLYSVAIIDEVGCKENFLGVEKCYVIATNLKDGHRSKYMIPSKQVEIMRLFMEYQKTLYITYISKYIGQDSLVSYSYNVW